MQIQLRGCDRAVTRLGLQRFDGHARFAQAGQAGVPQLVAGAVRQPGPGPAPEMISSRPSSDNGWPRRGPLSTTNSRSVDAFAGRSLFMYAATVAKKLGETGTSR